MSEEKRPEWMSSISGLVDPEEYLLGRKIDKTFELSQQQKAECARKARADLIASGNLVLDGDPILELERRKQQLKLDIISNPMRLRQLREKLLREERVKAQANTGSSSERQKESLYVKGKPTYSNKHSRCRSRSPLSSSSSPPSSRYHRQRHHQEDGERGKSPIRRRSSARRSKSPCSSSPEHRHTRHGSNNSNRISRESRAADKHKDSGNHYSRSRHRNCDDHHSRYRHRDTDTRYSGHGHRDSGSHHYRSKHRDSDCRHPRSERRDSQR